METSATKTFTNFLMKHHASVVLIELWEKGEMEFVLKLSETILRFTFQVAKEIWVCEGGAVTPYQGDIFKYKKTLKAKAKKDLINSSK